MRPLLSSVRRSLEPCAELAGRIGLSGSSAGAAHAAVVGNSLMYLALPGCRVLRWRTNRGGPPEEIELCKPAKGEAIHRLFLDPHGFHLLAALTTGRVMYLHARSGKPKKLQGWRSALGSCQLEAVAFDHAHVSETTTRGILLGDGAGRIYESVVDSTGKAATPALHYTLDTHAK